MRATIAVAKIARANEALPHAQSKATPKAPTVSKATAKEKQKKKEAAKEQKRQDKLEAAKKLR